jgi:hypothetical protein
VHMAHDDMSYSARLPNSPPEVKRSMAASAFPGVARG